MTGPDLSLITVRKGAPLRIPPKPFWFEKGWRQTPDAKEYTGYFKTAGRTWRGLIQQPYPGGYQAYIWHPPLDDIRHNTKHRACFNPDGETGRYRIHFGSVPRSLDHVITSVEILLAQACTGRAA